MPPTEAQRFVSRQSRQFESLLNRQKQQQQGLFNQFQQRSSAQPRLTDVFAQAQQERGLPQLQENIGLFQGQISDVKGLLDRLNENTAARTQGTQANQAFLDRLRAAEGGELNTQLGRLGAGLEPVVSAFQLGSQDVGQLLELTQAQQAKELRPLELQISSLSDRFSREITGFTTSKENELTTLLDKLQRERQLSDQAMQRARELAAEERENERIRKFLEEQAQTNSPLRTLPTLPQRPAPFRQPPSFPSFSIGGGVRAQPQPGFGGFSLRPQ